MKLELIAPAKLNLTLEVLGRREDGYHEVVSLMQAVDLADRVVVEASDRLELSVSGPAAAGVPCDERNLAYRAAAALHDAAGRRPLGARVALEKQVPTGGLGGGSSDAAAVLRGLNQLWGLGMAAEDLSRVAAGLGSDVAFFLQGGTALATGRGEIVEPLADIGPLELTLLTPADVIQDKTKRMYALLSPADYSDGSFSARAVEKLRRRERLDWWDVGNVFDRHLKSLMPRAAAAMRMCTQAGVGVVATGAGPAFFSLMPYEEIQPGLLQRLHEEFGVLARPVRTVTRADSLAVREV